MLSGVTHPWRRLRSLTHITLHWHDGGPAGITRFADNIISLRRGLSQAERRCTILHECVHVERGPVPRLLAGKEEVQVEKLTARLLLPDIRIVGEALAWSDQDLDEAAEELWVDQGTLVDRLTHLHPSERHWLTRRLAD